MKKVWVKFKCKACGETFWEVVSFKDKLSLSRYFLVCHFCKQRGIVHNEFFVVEIEDKDKAKETFWQKLKRWLGF